MSARDDRTRIPEEEPGFTPAFDDADGIAYDESGGVVISAPLMKIVGRAHNPVGSQGESPEIPVMSFVETGDESTYETVQEIDLNDYFGHRMGPYRGGLTKEEYEALPHYYRRNHTENGMYAVSVYSDEGVSEISRDYCALINAGYRTAPFNYASINGMLWVVYPFSKSWTEYQDANTPGEWTREVPDIITSITSCCGQDPTYRVTQSAAISESVSVVQAIGEPKVDDGAPREVDYLTENIWETDIVTAQRND
jgi:hypothetical protein